MFNSYFDITRGYLIMIISWLINIGSVSLLMGLKNIMESWELRFNNASSFLIFGSEVIIIRSYWVYIHNIHNDIMYILYIYIYVCVYTPLFIDLPSPSPVVARSPAFQHHPHLPPRRSRLWGLQAQHGAPGFTATGVLTLVPPGNQLNIAVENHHF